MIEECDKNLSNCEKIDKSVTIEIVEFYPSDVSEKLILGSLHVYLCEDQMDIRGIRVFVKGKRAFWFRLPQCKGWDEDKKDFVFFPVVNFTDSEKNKSIYYQIKKKGTDYIVNNFLNKEEIFVHPSLKRQLKIPNKKNTFKSGSKNIYKDRPKPVKEVSFKG